ncbi:MAG: hypothetical protein M0025_04880 [Elusimicrobia bacterium]|nr:hypothetical protein [Elusimicrobiota bacterium]
MRGDAVVLVAGRFVQALLTIAGFRVLTALLSPAEVGNYYLIISVASLFSMFLISPVGMYVNRRFFAWYDERSLTAHFLGYNAYAAAVSLLAFLSALAAWRFAGVGAGLNGPLFAFLVAAYIYVLNWNQNYIPALNTLGYRRDFVLLTLVTVGLALAFSALFSVVLSRGGTEWMAGLIVANGAATLAAARILYGKLREDAPGHFDFRGLASRPALDAIGAFALPLAGASFFMWAQSQSYRVIVERLDGAELLGYMAVGFSIATSVAGIMESLVQQLYLPAFYRRITSGGKDERRAALAELAAKSVPVYLVYLFFIAGSAELLVRTLVSPKYRDVFVYARYGAFVEFFRMATNVLAAAAHSEMRTRSLVRPYLIGGITAAVLVYFSAVSGRPGTYVPLALLLSGGVTFFSMQRAILPIIEFRLDLRALAAPAVGSLGLLAFSFIHPAGTLGTLGLLGLSGCYFAGMLYWTSRKWLRNVPSNPLSGPKAETENMSPAEPEAL